MSYEQYSSNNNNKPTDASDFAFHDIYDVDYESTGSSHWSIYFYLYS